MNLDHGPSLRLSGLFPSSRNVPEGSKLAGTDVGGGAGFLDYLVTLRVAHVSTCLLLVAESTRPQLVDGLAFVLALLRVTRLGSRS